MDLELLHLRERYESRRIVVNAVRRKGILAAPWEKEQALVFEDEMERIARFTGVLENQAHAEA